MSGNQPSLNPHCPRFGIALGGGAALGYAHLGVLDVLEREGLRPDLVVGTSMGAIVGASYIIGPTLDEVQRRFRVTLADPYIMNLNLDYLKQKADPSLWDSIFGKVRRGLMVTQSVIRDSIVDEESFSRIVRNLLPETDIMDMERPFACVSANLNSSKPRHCWTSGSLIQAVSASSAIPGIFPAQTIDGAVHVDGGAVESIPVPTAYQLGATFVIGVSVDDDDKQPSPDVAAEYFVAASYLSKKALTALQIEPAAMMLEPRLNQFHWADFQELDAIVEKGRLAAEEVIDEIRYLWQDHRKGFRKSIWSWIGRK